MRLKERVLTSKVTFVAAMALAMLASCDGDETPVGQGNNGNGNGTEEFNRVPAIGDNYQVHKFDWKGMEPGEGGENQTWDFSVLPSKSETMNLEVRSMDNSDYKNEFAQADFYTVNNFYGSRGLSDPGKNFHYFKVEDNKLIKLGRVDSMMATNVLLNTFGDPETQLQYPLTYNSSSTDEFHGSFTSVGIPFTWDGTDSYTVDGTGTLNILGKKIENVVRVKREREYLSDPIGQWTFTTYEWYKQGIAFPILVLHQSQEVFEGYYMDASEL
ncbi:MAG: hypothetical protein JJ975_03355 [Bacteroidia bacterium]|nr:hypothetical protein [Bacteroidia bacterium]